MVIADSNVALGSEHSVYEGYSTSVSRNTKRISGDRRTVAESSQSESMSVSISEEGKNLLSQSSDGTVKTVSYSAQSVSVESVKQSSYSVSSKEELELMMLSRLLEGLTGKKMPVRLLSSYLKDIGQSKKNAELTDPVTGKFKLDMQPIQIQRRPASTQQTTTTVESSYLREDKMQFNAVAQVTTADGMKIDLSIGLSMSRSFASSSSVSWETEVQLCDPLVFNFNGKGAELLGETFNFDIDNNGTSDQISRLSEGNGFLALDLNGDGAINDGGELFGARSGNGFADLAVYDQDRNGWIDENDEIFDKLQIFTLDKDGNQRLLALGELGIGAIYLGNVQSDYELRDGQNDIQGKITHSGFFLYENGNAGLVQNVNFRMYDTPMNEPVLYDAAV